MSIVLMLLTMVGASFILESNELSAQDTFQVRENVRL
jgi:hypothetical protein